MSDKLSIVYVIRDLAKGLELDTRKIRQDAKDETKDMCYTDALLHMSRKTADMSIQDPNWYILAGRLVVKFLEVTIPETFLAVTLEFKKHLHPDYYDFVLENDKVLETMIVPERNYLFDYFGINTLIKSYLLKKEEDEKFKTMEHPNYLYLRVATFMKMFGRKQIQELETKLERKLTIEELKERVQNSLVDIKRVYDYLSLGYYSHASPTLFNSGLVRSSCSSCFLMSVDDNIPAIGKSWLDSSIMSMNSGGIGMDFSALRHSKIGITGYSKGIISWLKIQNEILSVVDQGGKRNGSGCVFCCDWHVDFEEFIDARRNDGSDTLRARDLFYSAYVSDLFMKRVQNDEMWSLICPNKEPRLVTTWGEEFERLYQEAEEKGLYTRQVKARYLWKKLYDNQRMLGMPFITYKDAINRKCNQQNLGTIRCSNLCQEITQFSSKDETASCNLASISLDEAYYEEEVDGKVQGKVNYDHITKMAYELTVNLNDIIDRTYYPEEVPQIKYANLKHRPIAIGVQGLADLFCKLNLAWEYDAKEDGEIDKTRELNLNLFSAMYYGALCASCDLAKEHGAYSSYQGSPVSQGKLQFDMWEEEGKGYDFFSTTNPISEQKWNELREKIKKYGIRNSLLIAAMPTASTAQIRGKCEAFEPACTRIGARKVLSGQYMLVCKHLFKELKSLNLWKTGVVKQIMDDQGSVQSIEKGMTPEDIETHKSTIAWLKRKYKTSYEISQKRLLDLTIDRGRYVCQSQSHNCFFPSKDLTYQKWTSYHMYGWKRGIKTGMYYLRQLIPHSNINFASQSFEIKECVSCSA